ncbi:MAG: flavodoxin [Actinobacteria bacterium]|nr:flavodoxin [Actinomycetota bacterium]
MASVLVAYATKYGSTRDAAEVVASTLTKCGIDAAARPAGEVRSLDGYSAVVLGTALYFFMWRGEAHRFLRRNRPALSTLPVALFGLGPIEDTPEQFEGARGHLAKGLSKHAWFSPVSTAVFGGRLDPEHLRFPDNNPAMRGMAAVDLLDLAAVRSWADGLIETFDLEPQPGS